MQYATIPLHFWHGMDSNGICTFLFFYSSLSHPTQSHSISSSPDPALSLLPLYLIALSLVKDGFRCGYILAWAPAWVRWWYGSWVWQRGGSRRARSWQGGSHTHSWGEWVLMSGFRWGLGWFPSPGFFFFFPFSSPLYSISLVVFDVGFAFGFVWFAVPISLVVCVCVFFIILFYYYYYFLGGVGGCGFVLVVASQYCCGSGCW